MIGDLHAPCDPTSTIHVLDWDGDGEPELIASGNDIFAHKFVDTLADGTPVVDRGRRWGTISRSAQRDENDEGLTGFLLTASDFNCDGIIEAIIGLRYYSHKPVVALSLAGGAATDREAGLPVQVNGTGFEASSWAKGSDSRHRLERGRTHRPRGRQPGRAQPLPHRPDHRNFPRGPA